MATHFDLQEQEQLATLKHFWSSWGTLISVAVFAVVAAIAGFNGYQYWQSSQASKAAELFDQVRVGTEQQQADAVTQRLELLQSSYGKTVQASQASLVAGRYWVEKENWAAAADAFKWVASNSKDEGFRALATLHLTSVQMQQQQWDTALATLNGFSFPYEFRALRDDRKGDILQKQGKTQEAIAAYNAAFEAFEPTARYRLVVQSKLNALGQTPAALNRAGA
ncbi:YfgM family protein [Lampropedia puyangensis]|nr:tetratricopeptide repeat protein [Lampropedia puyangensis]